MAKVNDYKGRTPSPPKQYVAPNPFGSGQSANRPVINAWQGPKAPPAINTSQMQKRTPAGPRGGVNPSTPRREADPSGGYVAPQRGPGARQMPTTPGWTGWQIQDTKATGVRKKKKTLGTT